MKKILLPILTAAMLVSGTTTLLSANQGQKKQKPFLIQGKLPHLTMMVKILWDDEDLALTQKQKEKLLLVRQETIGAAKKLGKEIVKLENIVVNKSNAGATPASLKADVQKIANMRVEATMVHLKCIYDTRAILSKEQLYIVE